MRRGIVGGTIQKAALCSRSSSTIFSPENNQRVHTMTGKVQRMTQRTFDDGIRLQPTEFGVFLNRTLYMMYCYCALIQQNRLVEMVKNAKTRQQTATRGQSTMCSMTNIIVCDKDICQQRKHINSKS